jgi:hypothetical protein
MVARLILTLASERGRPFDILNLQQETKSTYSYGTSKIGFAATIGEARHRPEHEAQT